MKKLVFILTISILSFISYSQKFTGNSTTEFRTVRHDEFSTAEDECVIISLEYDITLSNGTTQTVVGNNSYYSVAGQMIILNISYPNTATINTRKLKFVFPNNIVRYYDMTANQQQAFSNGTVNFCPNSAGPSRILVVYPGPNSQTIFALTFI